jgi:transcription-repair coupling factor (superfamily II helicase)
MRGRVGRRTRRRFLFYFCRYSAMTDDARRNSGIEFSDWERLLYRMKIWKLWCRFRGEQSGFINEIGFDTYQKIMNEAIEEKRVQGPVSQRVVELCKSQKLILNCCSDEYINNISERLSLYSELGTIKK